MNIEEAKAFISSAEATEGDDPGKIALANHAFAEIEAALGRLASLGHRFHLVKGESAENVVVEYPKMLYRGGEETFAGKLEEEQRLVNEGWSRKQTASVAEVAEDAESSATKTVSFNTKP